MRIGRLRKKSEFMIVGMSMRTEIYQNHGLDITRFTYLNETPLKDISNPGETVENSDSKKKESRISESRNCYSMRKTVFSKMHAGNRFSKITTAEVAEDKTHLYGYCRRKTEFCVVLQLDTRLLSDENIWKKVLHLSFLLLR